MISRVLVASAALLLVSVPAFATDGKTPPESPLAKYKSQNDLLRSSASVANALGTLFKTDRSLYESEAFSDLKKKWPLFDSLEKLHAHRSEGANDLNQIGIFNSPALANVMGIDFGACAGVTLLSWISNHLVVFEAEGTHELQKKKADHPRLAEMKALVQKPSPTAEEKAKILAFYRPYIDRPTLDFEATIVPFFSSATAWTFHPALHRAFMWRAMELWFYNVSTIPGLTQMYAATNPKLFKLGYREVLSLKKKVQHYLDHHMNPIVFITAPGRSHHAKWIHVLQIWKIESSPEKKELVFYTLDPNYSGSERQHQIIFKGVGAHSEKISAYFNDPTNWGPNRQLLEVEMAPWMSNLATQTAESWLKTYRKDPGVLKLLAQ